MLHQNKGHARIIPGHGGEESFERRQSPSRRADADDREFRAILLGPRWLHLIWIDDIARCLRDGLCFGHESFPSISASSPSCQAGPAIGAPGRVMPVMFKKRAARHT